MTILLFLAGAVFFALAVAGVWLMQRAEAVPAARAVGTAPDSAEEEEARRSSVAPGGVLVERGDD
jgi:hypothetical protein